MRMDRNHYMRLIRQNLADTNDATFRLNWSAMQVIIPGDVTYCNGTLRADRAGWFDS